MQGTALGPLLFLICIDGVTTSFTSFHVAQISNCIFYADDLLIYHPIRCLADVDTTERDNSTILSNGQKICFSRLMLLKANKWLFQGEDFLLL